MKRGSTIHIRIAVAVDSGGEWRANGRGGGSEASCDDAMLVASEAVGDGAARYWVDVALPVPDEPAPDALVLADARVHKLRDDSGSVWVFNSEQARLRGGVFSSRGEAEAWIARHGLSGLLTEYPLNQGAYDWAIENGHFKNSKPATPPFVGGFTSGEQQHFHYESGATQQAESEGWLPVRP